MLKASRLNSPVWIVIPLLVTGFLIWCAALRVQQIIYVSGLGTLSAVTAPGSPTGYKGGRQWLIVPGHNEHSFRWIAETQQMFARGEWRVRHVDYDNAPFGRDAHSPSPYRWWLGLVAWFDHRASGQPIGRSVERAALVADPLLQLLLLLVTTIMVARWFGLVAAAFFSLGLATLFPLAVAFLPGAPNSVGMFLGLALWSVLPMVRAADVQTVLETAQSSRKNEYLFLFSGFVGGLGLWIGVAQAAPLLLGIALGGMAVAWLGHKDGQSSTISAKCWRMWALAGAATSLTAYFIEYFPAGLDWRPQVNHPIYGLAWLGLGELVAQLVLLRGPNKPRGNLKRAASIVLSLAALIALPVALYVTGDHPVFDPLAIRLSSLPGDAAASSVGSWLKRDGLNAETLITFLPLTAMVPILTLLASRSLAAGQKAALFLSFGPALAALVLAWVHLREWSTVDVMFLGATTVAVGVGSRLTISPVIRWVSLFSTVAVALGGLFRMLPSVGEKAKSELVRNEAVSLVERDIAYWIADRADADGAIILAPPFCSTSLVYYGGFRGLGSPAWENREGVSATIQIVSAITGDDANGRLNHRGVTLIVLPSWDNELEEFVRVTLATPADSLIAAIHRWGLPPWLRPLPYSLPDFPGFEDQSIVIIQVTDERAQWAFLARQAEYFLEMGQLDMAKRTSNALKLFPVNLSALAARVQVEKACADNNEFNATLISLRSQVQSNPSPRLPWDRRVSLAVALALGGEVNLARKEVQRCLQDIDELKIRDLSTGALYRLMFLSKTYDLPFPTFKLREFALELLPAEQRGRL